MVDSVNNMTAKKSSVADINHLNICLLIHVSIVSNELWSAVLGNKNFLTFDITLNC